MPPVHLPRGQQGGKVNGGSRHCGMEEVGSLKLGSRNDFQISNMLLFWNNYVWSVVICAFTFLVQWQEVNHQRCFDCLKDIKFQARLGNVYILDADIIPVWELTTNGLFSVSLKGKCDANGVVPFLSNWVTRIIDWGL